MDSITILLKNIEFAREHDIPDRDDFLFGTLAPPGHQHLKHPLSLHAIQALVDLADAEGKGVDGSPIPIEALLDRSGLNESHKNRIMDAAIRVGHPSRKIRW